MFDEAAYQKKYYRENAEKVRERGRLWRAANRERVREYAREYARRPERREKNSERAREWERRNPERALLSGARRRARKYGQEFDIDISDIVIPTHCPIFGMRLTVRGEAATRLCPSAASLDRIDPAKGYIRGNVWVISWKANRMKHDASPADLLLFSKRVVEIFDK